MNIFAFVIKSLHRINLDLFCVLLLISAIDKVLTKYQKKGTVAGK